MSLGARQNPSPEIWDSTVMFPTMPCCYMYGQAHTGVMYARQIGTKNLGAQRWRWWLSTWKSLRSSLEEVHLSQTLKNGWDFTSGVDGLCRREGKTRVDVECWLWLWGSGEQLVCLDRGVCNETRNRSELHGKGLWVPCSGVDGDDGSNLESVTWGQVTIRLAFQKEDWLQCWAVDWKGRTNSGPSWGRAWHLSQQKARA